jgi:hypothetical protein
MANALVFRRPYVTSTNGSAPLVFNESGAGFGALAAEVRLGGLAGAELGLGLLAAEVEIGGLAGAELQGFGALAAVVELEAEGAWTYDVNMWRGPVAQAAAGWREGDRRGSASRVAWGRIEAQDLRVGVGVRIGDDLDHEASAVWGRLDAASAASGIAWNGGKRYAVTASAVWRSLPHCDIARKAAWTSAKPLRTEKDVPWIMRRRLAAIRETGWREGRLAGIAVASGARTGRRLTPGWALPWRLGILPVGVRPETPPPPPPTPYQGQNNLVFIGPLSAGNRIIFNRRWRPAVPLRRVYLVLHDVSLVRLPDRTPIETSGFTLAWDADRRDIDFSATVLGKASLDAVLPDSNGTPVVLEASVDGYVFQVLVEDWDEDRQARKRGIGIQGRSLSAYLSAPYVLPTSRTSTQDRTAQQLAAEELPLAGWALDWTAPDWLIPAGAWSASNQTPIQALQILAAVAGAIVVPAKAGQALTVQPRYPVLPWNYAATPPDLVIPEAALTHLQRRNAIPTQANAVYLQGGEAGGVLARVLLTGSAGDRLLPTVQDNLITHLDAARGLGERLLAGQWRQPEVRSVTLPVDGNLFPLMEIGQLARIDLDGGPVYGIVNGVSLAVAMTKGLSVRQTLSFGEDTPNVWARFAKLLPQDPLLVGTVSAVHGDGTVSVTLVGGGTRRVRGTATVGQSVYIRSGRIDGQAPSLPSVEIEI